jgi:hypothetical protein
MTLFLYFVVSVIIWNLGRAQLRAEIAERDAESFRQARKEVERNKRGYL